MNEDDVRWRPILFSVAEVRAAVAGRKTQARRVVRPQPHPTCSEGGVGWHWHPRGRAGHYLWSGNPEGLARSMADWCPHGRPGDRLWVRESVWLPPPVTGRMLREGADTWPECIYRAGQEDGDREWCEEQQWVKVPSPRMPRWASRLTLEVTAVRAERLQQISEADALDEGALEAVDVPYNGSLTCSDARPAFRNLWDHTRGRRPGCSWADDPWVWVLHFRADARRRGGDDVPTER